MRPIERPSRLGAGCYELTDTKLVRETKDNTVRQISLYSDLLRAPQDLEPESAFVLNPGANHTRPSDIGSPTRSPTAAT
jgi:uncharacterized protein